VARFSQRIEGPCAGVQKLIKYLNEKPKDNSKNTKQDKRNGISIAICNE
jgi:hypothetical protein